MPKISDFLTPQSAPRHDSTTLLGVRLKKRGPQKAKKCCTVALFAQQSSTKHGLADKSPSTMQPNRLISRFSKVKPRKIRVRSVTFRAFFFQGGPPKVSYCRAGGALGGSKNSYFRNFGTPFSSFWAPGASGGSFGTPLGPFWGSPGALLAPPGAHFGPPGASWGSFLGLLGPPGAHFLASWALLGLILGLLGPPGAHFALFRPLKP